MHSPNINTVHSITFEIWLVKPNTGDYVDSRCHICQIKSPLSSAPLELLVRSVPETSKTIQATAFALDCSLELDGKKLLLKTVCILVTEHRTTTSVSFMLVSCYSTGRCWVRWCVCGVINSPTKVPTLRTTIMANMARYAHGHNSGMNGMG